MHTTSSATSFYGATGNGAGEYAAHLAESCFGDSSGNGSGIYVDTTYSPGQGTYGAALNCTGNATDGGTGLAASIANSCVETSFSVGNKYNMP